jgi:Tfp pilus assembly protein PilF
LEKAIDLDPQGMAEVHLRLAWLYDSAGMKEKASREYRQFLDKRPDSPQRKRLEEYIEAARKP